MKSSEHSPYFYDKVYSNVSQELIQITADKLKIILNEHVSKVEQQKCWHTPLVFLATLILALVTTEPKTEPFGLTADTWTAIFIILAGLALCWLIKSVFRAVKYPTIDDLIKRIKES